MNQPGPISFRRLAEDDLALLSGWLNREHLRPFYQKTPVSMDEVRKKYLPRIEGRVPAHCHLAIMRNNPIGYLQCYRIADWPDWKALTGITDGIGTDLFLGEPDLLGQGIGTAMLDGYLREVALCLFPEEQACFIAHHLDNAAARAYSRAAGFVPFQTFVEEGMPMELMRVMRRDLR
ncbi:MAG: GNAT family N-acetyltransferase [Alphaproteobacteria bacterium]|nr:GNAT family N-acetyltransferase [Alphaproteobacteria bacterium]